MRVECNFVELQPVMMERLIQELSVDPFHLYLYVHLPAVLLVVTGVYLFLDGRAYPMRCLVVAAAPYFFVFVAILSLYKAHFLTLAYNPIFLPPITLTFLGSINAFGPSWGKSWRLAIAFLLLEQALFVWFALDWGSYDK